jgi:hypothetical protein
MDERVSLSLSAAEGMILGAAATIDSVLGLSFELVLGGSQSVYSLLAMP